MGEKYQRDFKGVWIPKEIWLNRDLSVMEKLFLVEIDSLDNEQGCFASNKHFSDFFDISKGRCTQIIKSLEEKGLVSINYEYEGKQIIRRTIRVVNKSNRVVNKLNRVVNKLNDGSKNTKRGYLENAGDNNTLINNTSNNTINKDIIESSAKAEPPIPYKEIIEHLNLATNSNYRHYTKSTQQIIKARFNEGFTLNDFIKVIDTKTNEWINDNNMAKYLRPQTLFGNKFESYLNQSTVQPKELGHTADAPTESSQVKYDDDELEYANNLIEKGVKQFNSLNAEEQKQLNAWRQRNAIPLLERA